MKAGVVLVLSFAWSSLAVAEPIAIVGGRVVTVSGPAIDGGTVLIAKGKISQVGKSVAVPGGAKVIDAAGKWVTPGLIESYTQLGGLEIWAVPESNDVMPETRDPIRAAIRMDDAVNLRSSLVAVARRHGVTSVLTTPVGGLIAGRSVWVDLVDEDGDASDAISGPIAMHVNLGEAGSMAVQMSRAAAWSRLREVLDDADLFRKDRTAFRKNQLRKLRTSRLDLEALVPVITGKMPLVIKASRASDIRRVLAFSKRRKLDVILIGAEEAWIVADEIARAKVPVIVDPFANLPRSFESRAARADNAAILAERGVKVLISTGSTHNAANLRFALGNAVRAGLAPDEALRAATAHPADVFGRSEYGSLARGKVANVVVWSGDPFEPSTVAETVVVRGEVRSTESRQTRLRDRYKAALGL